MKKGSIFKIILYVPFLYLLLLLNSCGFHLRGTEQPLSTSQTIYLETDSPYSTFIHQLNNHLRSSHIRIADTPDQASIILSILDEQMTTRQISIGSSEYTQEHMAVYSVKYSFKSPKGKILIKPTTIHTQRKIITLPHEELTNSYKPGETRQVMQEELITQIFLHLSTKNKNLL